MSLQMQNPSVEAGALCNQLRGCLHTSPTPSQRQEQIISLRFALSPSTARVVAEHCYGEHCYD